MDLPPQLSEAWEFVRHTWIGSVALVTDQWTDFSVSEKILALAVAAVLVLFFGHTSENNVLTVLCYVFGLICLSMAGMLAFGHMS
ncbi:MAG TPA: hypothetical protein VIX59_05165 [Candidatus Binataceae bacterium]|jgi:hypothetical protein